MRPIGQMLNFGQLLDDSVQDYGNTTASPWFDWSDGIAAGPAVDVSVSLPMSFQPPEHAAISGPVPADPFAGVTSAVPMTVWPPAAQAAPGLAWPGDPFAGASSAIPMTVQPPAVPSLLAAPGPVQTSAPVVASPMSSAEIAPLDINTGMAGVSLVSSGVSASEPGTIITNSTSFSGGVATATDASDLNALIKAADSASSGTLTIDISGSLSLNTLPAVSNGESVNFVNGTITAITAVPDIAAINLKSGVSLVFNGSNNATLDGRDTVRGLFAYSGSVTVDNLTLQNMVALGGAGGAGSNAGGGGAGLGGGLFVGATAKVTLNSVTFSNDQAMGGAGGNNTGGGQSGNAGGGGGGLGGNGGVAFGQYMTGGGGVGRTAFGGEGTDHATPTYINTDKTAYGGKGIIYSAAAGGGHGESVAHGFGWKAGAYGGGGGSAQAGDYSPDGGTLYYGGAGGGGGVSGKNGYTKYIGSSKYTHGGGGAGGFGGGGGAGYYNGGAGGFGGGGGGGEYTYGGNGGFGGGGGGQQNTGKTLGAGGFGGGNGGGGPNIGNYGTSGTGQPESQYKHAGGGSGGGGLGAGGDLFVQSGGVLTFGGAATINGGTVTGGAAGVATLNGTVITSKTQVINGDTETGFGTDGTAGAAFGSDIFIQNSNTNAAQGVTFAPGSGQLLTLSGVIADEQGSGGTGANASQGKLLIQGGGEVRLTGSNTFEGGSSISASSTLDLGAGHAGGSGAISFGTGNNDLILEALALPNGSLFSNTVSGFVAGDTFDLSGLTFHSGATAHIASNTLTVVSNSVTDTVALGTTSALNLVAVQDSGSGTMIEVHNAPTVTAGATASFAGGGLAVVADSGLSITDSSSTTLVSATVVVGGLISGDTLNFSTQNGISESSFSTGTLSLSGTATVAQYQTALESITYGFTAGDDPTGGGSHTSRTLDWSVNDGVLNSGTVTSTVNITHTAPTVTAGGTVTFDGGGSPVTLDSGVAVSDVDSGGVLSSATVTVASAITGDTLNFSNTNSTTEGNVAVASDSNGVLKLTSSGSTATIAQWQTALASVTYSFSPSNGYPTNGGGDTSRTIDWVVSDGNTSNGTSGTSTSKLDTVHTAPTVTAGATATFTGGGGAVVLDSGLAVSDVDSGGVLSSATVTVAGAITGDTLNFTNINSTTEGNVAVASDSNGVLKLTSAGSTATLAQWQTALASVTYSFSPSFGDPTNGGGDTSRTIDWLVNDGVLNSGTVTSTLDVTHVAPALTTSGTATFDGGGSAVTLDSGASISDPDSGGTLHSATVSVASFVSGDILSATTTGTPSIIVNYNTTTGTLTLTGTDTLADYQAALRSVSFSFNPSNGDPTGGGSHTSSTIDWSINDGVASSGTTTSTLNVVHVAPTVTASGTVDYGPLGSPAVLDSTLTASDPDSGGNLTGATVDISSGFTTGDALNFATQNGITESGFSNGTLSLTGAASIANYQAALRSVTYSSSLSDPTVGGTDNSRTISWSVNDGVTISAVPTSTVDVFACFVTGTRIATRDGPRPVEALRIGDLVLTRSGEARPIRWIGHRSVDPRRHPRPEQVHPLRIAAGAFGPGRPERPVFVSPDHGICVDGVDAGASVLVPAGLLANGVNIARVDLGAVTYWHVELDTHDVIMAEGLPVESWLDDGRRDNFDNGEAPVRSHPDFAPPSNAWRWEAAGCLRMVLTGPLLEAARRQAEGPDWRGPGVRAGWTLPFAPPYRASGPPRQTAA